MDDSSPLGTGAVVGLSITVTFLIALTVGLGVLCYFWWGRQKKTSDSQQPVNHCLLFRVVSYKIECNNFLTACMSLVVKIFCRNDHLRFLTF